MLQNVARGGQGQSHKSQPSPSQHVQQQQVQQQQQRQLHQQKQQQQQQQLQQQQQFQRQYQRPTTYRPTLLRRDSVQIIPAIDYRLIPRNQQLTANVHSDRDYLDDYYRTSQRRLDVAGGQSRVRYRFQARPEPFGFDSYRFFY